MFIGAKKVGGKCPACSSEIDKGGRLELRKRKNEYLVCGCCSYVVRTVKAQDEQTQLFKKRRDRKIFRFDSFKRKRVKKNRLW